MITAAILQELGASWRNAAQYVAPLNATAERYEITTPRRVACWLGQLAHESRSFSTVVENLNYSAPRLLAVFPKYFDAQSAEEYARNPARIASRVYGGRMGNGSEATSDGWHFRGRGLIQITGRENYERCGNALGVDLTRRPGLLEQPMYAALSAGWFWDRAKLNDRADRMDIAGITRAINGGTNGAEDRIQLTAKALRALGGL
ncbi:MAG: putative chitinase [Thauera sp.]|nr:glycoside hydrolase family 19 protein [Thauera sp.]MDI3489576.1 putative chitinase [Thauera sp.]